MTARVLDGKAAAAEIRAELTRRAATLAARGILPGLGTVLVGDDPGSRAYVNGKHRDCAPGYRRWPDGWLPCRAASAR